jgi:hypothetical protein
LSLAPAGKYSVFVVRIHRVHRLRSWWPTRLSTTRTLSFRSQSTPSHVDSRHSQRRGINMWWTYLSMKSTSTLRRRLWTVVRPMAAADRRLEDFHRSTLATRSTTPHPAVERNIANSPRVHLQTNLAGFLPHFQTHFHPHVRPETEMRIEGTRTTRTKSRPAEASKGVRTAQQTVKEETKSRPAEASKGVRTAQQTVKEETKSRPAEASKGVRTAQLLTLPGHVTSAIPT